MNRGGTIAIGNKELKVKIADTPAEREQGLQNVEKIEDYDGMLFVFEKKSVVSFWNKNTLMDLDVVWIVDKKVLAVGNLSKESEHGRMTISSPGEVDMVLELPKGRASEFGLSEGTLIR